MFVDASAIVAILTNEPEADALTDRLERAIRPIASAIAIAIAVFEATLGLCRKTHVTVVEAEADIADFMTQARITLVPVAASEASLALRAFDRYGKGRGHPAQLNMGDCFSYAVASNRRTSLLYKGKDFSQTDMKDG